VCQLKVALLKEFYQGSDLFSVSINGGEITQLTNTANSGGIIQSNFKLSVDGQWVVFTLNDFSTTEVFSVFIEGGDSNLLNMPLNSGRSVMNFSISPDSQHVVYIADQSRAGIVELYSLAEYCILKSVTIAKMWLTLQIKIQKEFLSCLAFL